MHGVSGRTGSEAPADGQNGNRNASHSLALVPTLTHFLVEVDLDPQDELQFLVGDEGGQGAVDPLARLHRLPVVLVPQVHPVAAGCPFVVVPTTGTLLCGGGQGRS